MIREIIRVLSAVGALFLLVAVALADESVTFENLHEHLSHEQIAAIPDFDGLLTEARDGALEARLTLANEIYFDRLSRHAFGLYLQIYREQGLQFNQNTNPWEALNAYARLGDMYLEGRGTPVDPEAGFKLLVEAATHGHLAAVHSLKFFLAESPYLPGSGDLGDLWDRHQKDLRDKDLRDRHQKGDLRDRHQKTGVSFGAEDISEEAWENDEEAWENDEEEPADQLFGACANAFGQTAAIVEQFHRRQESMLEDGQSTDEELSSAYASFEFQGVKNGNRRVTFDFSDITATPLFRLLADVMEDGLKFKIRDSVNEMLVLINGKDLFSMLVFSQLVEQLELEVSCHEKWVLIAPKSTRAEPGKLFVFPNFVVRREPADGSGVGSLQWKHGVRYDGSIRDGRPHGQGRLLFADKPEFRSELVGEFRNGVPHGQAELITTDDINAYTGEYRDGMFHGQGHFRFLTGIDFKGRFVNNEFHGNGSNYLKGDPKREGDWLIYRGPFKAGTAHGAGVCETPDITYNCQFADGFPVGLGEVSLLPGHSRTEVAQ